MGVLPSPPAPLGFEELRVSLSHRWSKAPSPALPGPSPDILGSAFPWLLGGAGVHVLSLCVWVTGLCLCVSGYVCVSGPVYFGVYLCLSLCLQTSVFRWVVGELRTDGTEMSMCVFLCCLGELRGMSCVQEDHKRTGSVAQW